jgi:hypothetical protein
MVRRVGLLQGLIKENISGYDKEDVDHVPG